MIQGPTSRTSQCLPNLRPLKGLADTIKHLNTTNSYEDTHETNLLPPANTRSHMLLVTTGPDRHTRYGTPDTYIAGDRTKATLEDVGQPRANPTGAENAGEVPRAKIVAAGGTTSARTLEGEERAGPLLPCCLRGTRDVGCALLNSNAAVNRLQTKLQELELRAANARMFRPTRRILD